MTKMGHVFLLEVLPLICNQSFKVLFPGSGTTDYKVVLENGPDYTDK